MIIKATKWVLGSMTIGILAMGCAVGTGQESESESAGAEEPTVEPQAAGIVKTTVYYSDDDFERRTIVGACTFSSCPPKGTSCWGVKTPYYDIFTSGCF